MESTRVGFCRSSGGSISGSTDAYKYLPESIKKFPTADELRQLIRSGGFPKVGYEYLSSGIAALHIATK